LCEVKMDIVVSGMRPTGRLHIGHYFGAIRNWVKLQEQYDCYFFVADWHALTTHLRIRHTLKRIQEKWYWTGWLQVLILISCNFYSIVKSISFRIIFASFYDYTYKLVRKVSYI